jgi:hypothetical protein
MKQVDFDVRVFTLNPGGINGGYTHEGMVAFVKANYPSKDGWEVRSVENVQMSADGVSVLVFLAKYVS